MRDFFADLHIHIGWSEDKKPVKISASKNLNFINIVHEAYHNKGLDMIGIIDCHSPLVQREILKYVEEGVITELEEGGLLYKDLTIILGSEIEIKEEGRGAAHYLVFFPYLNDIISFSSWMSERMKNINLSSQRLYVTTLELQKEVKARNGLFIPAHIFTPFKSVYGKCCNSFGEVMDINLIDAVELGLSSDTSLADSIEELHQFSFLTNSDAHSLQKIGREYNKLLLQRASFKEFKLALKGMEGRKIASNYGLDPKLGKYFKSRCLNCEKLVEGDICKNCGSTKIVKGVSNRIEELSTKNGDYPVRERPSYVHQVPLEFIPKLGPRTLEKLLAHFGTEMNILHRVKKEDLEKVIPKNLANHILNARAGKLPLIQGGGGAYGKVLL